MFVRHIKFFGLSGDRHIVINVNVRKFVLSGWWITLLICRNTWVRLRPKNCFPSELLYVFNDWTQENIEIMLKSYSWDGG